MDKLHPRMPRFCDSDDYNWDQTLVHMSQDGDLGEEALTPRISRVVHIGACGLHSQNTRCDPQPVIDEYE